MVAAVEAIAAVEAQIILTDLSIGHYNVVAVSSMGFVCNSPFFINLVENSKPPNLDVETYNVTQGDSLRVSSDKDGTIYLVIEGTTPDNIFLHATRIKDSIKVMAGIPIGFPTMDLYPKGYLLYALDAFGQFSEATQVTVGPSGISIANSGGIRIYPNPVNNILTIQSQRTVLSFIKITSINGQRMYNDVMERSIQHIDLSTFEKGVYFITIRSIDFVTTRKIIKL